MNWDGPNCILLCVHWQKICTTANHPHETKTRQTQVPLTNSILQKRKKDIITFHHTFIHESNKIIIVCSTSTHTNYGSFQQTACLDWSVLRRRAKRLERTRHESVLRVLERVAHLKNVLEEDLSLTSNESKMALEIALASLQDTTTHAMNPQQGNKLEIWLRKSTTDKEKLNALRKAEKHLNDISQMHISNKV